MLASIFPTFEPCRPMIITVKRDTVQSEWSIQKNEKPIAFVVHYLLIINPIRFQRVFPMEGINRNFGAPIEIALLIGGKQVARIV